MRVLAECKSTKATHEDASLLALLAGCLLVVEGAQANAGEYAFSTYGLAGNALGPPSRRAPGTHVTPVAGFYAGKIGASVNFGGVVNNAVAKVDGFTSYFSAQNA
jgi:hypothetical protein